MANFSVLAFFFFFSSSSGVPANVLDVSHWRAWIMFPSLKYRGKWWASSGWESESGESAFPGENGVPVAEDGRQQTRATGTLQFSFPL